MSEENERRVGAMAEEEREQERREIEERFGKNIGDVLRRVRIAREIQEKQKKAAPSLEGDLMSSRSDGGSGIAMPLVSPGSSRTFQSKCYMRGTDPLKAVSIVPTRTPSHLPFLLHAKPTFDFRRTADRATFPFTNSFKL
jgi:hypothetical protein